MNRRNWTEEEDNYIKEHFGKITISEMANFLGCSFKTVQDRAIKLGLNVQKKKANRWTEEEIELLKFMAPKYLNKTIARKLNRPLCEVNKKARKLGIKLIYKRPVWKKWMIDYLKDNINKISLTKMQKVLGVDYYQIMDMIEKLNIPYISNRWTKEEEELLTILVPKFYIVKIAEIFNRSEQAVVSKARKMNLDYITLQRKYSNEDLKYIKDNWGIIPISKMARKLKVSRIMITNQAKIMGLPPLGNNPYRKWTDDKIEELKILSKTKTRKQISEHFNTTEDAISSVVCGKDITLINSKVHWSDEDNKKLEELAKTMDLEEISLVMNRNTSAIRIQAKRLNIEIIPNKKHANSIWTTENTKQLEKLASEGKTFLEICIIMDKTDTVIRKKAKEFDITIKKDCCSPWTDEEIKRFKELSKTKTINELVKEFKRSTSSIKSLAKRENIQLLTDRKNWTKEDLMLLEKYITVDKKTPAEIAQLMDRTIDSIIVKASRQGLKIQTNDKKFWTEEEENILTDLWGNISIEKIAKQLNRTTDSIRNKAFMLGLGNYLENNYDGLTIKEISELLNINMAQISVVWVSLGLKCKTREISKSRRYRYVEIKDLYEFLEKNQNIWDSRNLEKNILGKEPDWLLAKRKKDLEENPNLEKLLLNKQRLILAKQYLVQLEEENDIILANDEDQDEHPKQYINFPNKNN